MQYNAADLEASKATEKDEYAAGLKNDVLSEKVKGVEERTPLLPGRERHQALSSYITDLRHNFGCNLLILLFVCQHLLKGCAGSLVNKAVPYLYRKFHVAAPQAQIYGGIVNLPWAMKPICGLVSDVMPIFGYHKGPYILIVAVLGAYGYVNIALFTPDQVKWVVIYLVFITFQISVTDLLTEAKYAEKIKAAPHAGPSLLTYVWTGINVGAFFAVMASGPLLDNFGSRACLMVAAIPAMLVIAPLAAGCLEEKQVSSEEVAETRRRYYEQKEACFLCFIMLAGTLTIMAVGVLKEDPWLNSAVAVGVGCTVLACFSMALTPVIAKANAFAVLYTAMGASTSGASFYFYTDSPEMYPEGPHFSDFFYNSVIGTCGTAFTLIGLFVYQTYLGSMSYRKLIIITTVVSSVLSFVDILMFARVNVKLGIPDDMLVLGMSVFQSMLWEWQWMPQVVLLANLCPKGMEATMFALLAGCHNLGTTISSSTGALLLHCLGVAPRGEAGESAQFENLWIAASVSTVLPLFAAVLLQQLLPDSRQDEKLDAVEDPTKDSILRRWLGRA
mmetsp:Transcript_59438/g.105721  ORF Transcript_59438/g.105721 Transcript_59438/m.105721 type:complete len:559 (+) Transcript_59438:115-1791(+)|eukprot:CAMPEP_0197660142 /NCGR_PEP_ID=MMETSP1338-20131121/50665_1 /TAXON_ID=43686 ORGANISM="Pelagodinium beii, Strain RCC1491" /NCGR_SAMPLE_ID=MMETSP1338 /ASSEMBLY_ACC=CAM_ASM_000754 /LENGTH=558 /DNA_ID=CAMNT_0043237433 /DNA_START=115 /DNA_END=1791 /DNA_ORIENTATION=-